MKQFKSVRALIMAGTMMLAVPAFAASPGGHGGGGFSRGGGGGGQHFSAPAARGFSGGRGFSDGARGFEGRGSEHRDFDRGYHRGGGWGFGVGAYPGYAYPYGYGYVDPYYDPYYYGGGYYAAPAPIPACNPNGSYDANGNLIPDPNCPVPPATAAPAPQAVPYGY